MPIIYSSVFLAIGLALGVLKGLPWSEEVAAVTTVLWLIAGHLLVAWETRAASSGRHVARE